MYADTPNILLMLGTAYVKFFYKNPLYFDFLFSRKNIQINLSLDCAGEKEIPPLKTLKQIATQTFRKIDMPESVMQNKIIAMWALVHGLSAIATMPNVEYDKDWETRIEEIIQSLDVWLAMRMDLPQFSRLYLVGAIRVVPAMIAFPIVA